ncbi:MAG TPA: hypothetical protein VJ397_09935 [Thermoplasmata archaeon]|nr:hypothetical protein [Thermoplasmata archaeon]
MDPRRALALAMAAAFLGLLALYAYSASLWPTRLALTEIGADDVGKYVEVRGVLRSTETTRSGGASLVLLDLGDFATLRAFVARRAWTVFPDRAIVLPGAEVLARGELQAFGDEVILQVDQPSDLEILRPAEGNRVPLRTLAARAPDLEGMNVTAAGVLAEPRMVLDYSRVRLSAGGLALWAVSAEGAEGVVDVCGTLEFEPLRERWELLVPANGSAPHPSTPRCGFVPLADLLSAPGEFAGRWIGVAAMTATRGELVGTAFELRDGGYAFAGFVRGDTLPEDIAPGDLVEFTGTLEYHRGTARYRIASDAPTLRAA